MRDTKGNAHVLLGSTHTDIQHSQLTSSKTPHKFSSLSHYRQTFNQDQGASQYIANIHNPCVRVHPKIQFPKCCSRLQENKTHETDKTEKLYLAIKV